MVKAMVLLFIQENVLENENDLRSRAILESNTLSIPGNQLTSSMNLEDV